MNPGGAPSPDPKENPFWRAKGAEEPTLGSSLWKMALEVQWTRSGVVVVLVSSSI